MLKNSCQIIQKQQQKLTNLISLNEMSILATTKNSPVRNKTNVSKI